MESFLDLVCPQAPGRAIFGDFLEEIVVGIKEKREPRDEIVDLESRVERRLHVGQTVIKSESQFLDGRGASLANMVAADAQRMISRRGFDAETKDVVDHLE